MIDLIATDLDGTLFFSKRKIRLITLKNRHFLRKYIKSGKKVVLVSGRNFYIAKRITKRIHFNVDMIACNGSAIYKDEKIISDNPLDHEKVKRLYESNIDNKDIVSWVFMTNEDDMILVPNGMHSFVKVLYRLGMLLQFKYRGSYRFGKKHFYKMINKENVKIYKAMCVCGLGEKGSKKARELSFEFKKKYPDDFEIMWSSEAIEFMNKGVNKATALLKLIENENIKRENVAVVGDSGNDLPLFENFENSFSMAQADDEIKEKAKYVVDGVYSLEEYVNK